MFITRKAEFSASHVCRIGARGGEENERIYGQDAHPNGHGHNFVLEVTVEGDPDPVTGMILDLKTLKEILDDEVIDPMDHRFLNYEVQPFGNVVPTPENIAIEIWKRIDSRLSVEAASTLDARSAPFRSQLRTDIEPRASASGHTTLGDGGTRLHRVRLYETADLYVDVLRGDILAENGRRKELDP